MTKREKLLERLSDYIVLPSPNIESKSDEELERYINLLDSTFKTAFGEEEA